MKPVVERIRAGQPPEQKAQQSFLRAIGALDFSTTPNGRSWLVRTELALMLMDVLNRIGLPPSEEIPGDEAVGRESLQVWTVPGSPIRLCKVDRVGRGSEFLFAPETVERLDRYHRRTRDLASKRGLPSMADAFVADPSAAAAVSRTFRSRLERIDRASPRSTLEGFLESVNRAFAIVQDTEAALRADPPTMTPQEAREAERLADTFLARAASTLDLREVPLASREDVGLETVLQLKEIIDRDPLPPYETIPGKIRVQSRDDPSQPFTWDYPNTEIDIVEIQDGENRGLFLFSARSVRLMPASYELVKDLPYSTRWSNAEDYRSPDTSPGFYSDYIGSPGYLVPSASRLGSLVDALPDGMKRVYYDQTLWQWSGLLIFILLTPAAILFLFLLIRRWKRRLKQPGRAWLSIVAPAVGCWLVFRATDFLDTELNITGQALTTTQAGGRMIAATLGIWAVLRLSVAVSESIIASPRTPDVGLNATLIRIAGRVVGFFAGLWIAIAVIKDLGIDLIPLIAGLGVGGLAVALAAQRTFANMLDGIILYLNKPVRLGDFCIYGDGKMGIVEDIGLLSTRIRTLERSVVTIPNADFSQYAIDNLMVRDRRLFMTRLQLRYETSPRQLRYVIARLRQLLDNHPKVEPEPRVRFVDLGEYSFDVEIFAYLSCQDHNIYLAIREDLLMQIIDVVEEAGTEFAFPSAVEYQADASEMNAERGKEVEARVEQWWAEGKLARPGFKESRADQSEATTGYIEESSSSASVPSETGDGEPAARGKS